MDPITNNQMNSMYQAPLGQQPVHKTSIISIIVLLLVTIIVAVLGFGRIKNMKEEQVKMLQKEAKQAEMIQKEARNQAALKAREEADTNILIDLENISSSPSEQDIKSLESAF